MSIVIERKRPVIGSAVPRGIGRSFMPRTLESACGVGARLTIEQETFGQRCARFAQKVRMRIAVAFWSALAWLTNEEPDGDESFFRGLDIGVAGALIVLVVIVAAWKALA